MSCKPINEETKKVIQELWPEEAAAATPAHVLRTQVMDPRIPKNEREWWASHRIAELEQVLNLIAAASAEHWIREKALDVLGGGE